MCIFMMAQQVHLCPGQTVYVPMYRVERLVPTLLRARRRLLVTQAWLVAHSTL